MRRFRAKDRVASLSDEEVQQLYTLSNEGDALGQYGYGRWLYYLNPYAGAIQEAERLLYAAKDAIPDALAAYAQMLRYGETVSTHPPFMDIEGSVAVLDEAERRGSELAAICKARSRIYGVFCEAAPRQVAEEIEQRLAVKPDSDPMWYTLLAFACEQTGKAGKAIELYEKAIALGEMDDYAYLAALYKERGNFALGDEYIEEGCRKGSAFCCLCQAENEDYNPTLHEQLLRGLKGGEGACAYFLWQHYYYGDPGYEQDMEKAFAYLKRGVELADSSCIAQMAKSADDGALPPSMSLTPFERDLLRLRAARYCPNNSDALIELRKADDPAFLLKYKDELDKYWRPRFCHLDITGEDDDDEYDDDGRYDAYV